SEKSRTPAAVFRLSLCLERRAGEGVRACALCRQPRRRVAGAAPRRGRGGAPPGGRLLPPVGMDLWGSALEAKPRVSVRPSRPAAASKRALSPEIKLTIIVAVQHAQDNLADILAALRPAAHPQVEFLFCHTTADPDVPALVGREGHVRVLRGAD